MRWRILTALSALLGSLSLTVPVAWAAPSFPVTSIAPVVFATSPGASCSAQPPNSVGLPIATGTGAISYAIANLPADITFDDTTGVLSGDPATITAQAATPYTYTATDNEGTPGDTTDDTTATLGFTLEVVDERAVLQAFYQATNGDTWTTKTNWANPISTTTCLEDLFGVSLHVYSSTGTVGRVRDLALPNNNLTGSLPADLGKLTSLTRLLLYTNRLSGTIPDLSALTKLTNLHLHTNRLSGEIPDLSSLTSLTNLLLHTNRLSGEIPAAVGTLTALTSLRLENNQLSGEIPDLSALTNLPELWLSNNQLTGPIPALPTGLQGIFLHFNQLTGPIPALPTGLQRIFLAFNRLSGPIPDLRTLTQLWQLELGSNRLGLDANGRNIETPDLDNRLPTGLQRLGLYHNQLSGPLRDVSGLTALTHFHIYHNQLTGPLPDVSALTNLQEFSIRNNRLGTDPNGPNRRTDISGLAGTLPAASLTKLWLSHNGLHGELPDLDSLTSLTDLFLSHNQLSGAIPRLPSSLSWLELQHNALTGPLPPDLNSLKFAGLYLHNNQLSGPIPAFSGSTGTFRLTLYGNPGLYGYPSALGTKSLLRLPAPGTGAAVCLPTTMGGTDCTVPALVDNLYAQALPTELFFSWSPKPADPAPSGYTAQYYPPGSPKWLPVPPATAVSPATTGTTARITGLTPGATYLFRVRTTKSPPTPWLYYVATLPESAPPPPTSTGTGTGGGSGGGGGGGGRQPRSTPDQHGDTPAEATSLNPRRYTTGSLSRQFDARLQSRTDVDYFEVEIPHAGVLTASTTGGVDTTGRVYQAQEDGAPVLLATDTDGGPSRNFSLGAAVEPGTYYLAVSAGRSFGDYTLRVHYTPASFGSPAPGSFQSGLGVLAGWVCDAETVTIELETVQGAIQTYEPATGTSRLDTAGVCGADTTDTGFGLLYNWNLLGDGQHIVRAVINDVEFAERQITVTTLGQEYRRGLRATTEVPDFPAAGQTTALRWEEAGQNFVIARGEGGGGGAQLTPEQAWLGAPAPGSFQSGLGVIAGWVCEADTVEIAIETADGMTQTYEAGYGTARADTADTCGDTDNGFGLLFNWNLLGDGPHTVRALADGEAFAHSTVTVTTLGQEFAQNLHKTHTIPDFPEPGQTTTVEWQEGQQNFVITGIE